MKGESQESKHMIGIVLMILIILVLVSIAFIFRGNLETKISYDDLTVSCTKWNQNGCDEKASLAQIDNELSTEGKKTLTSMCNEKFGSIAKCKEFCKLGCV